MIFDCYTAFQTNKFAFLRGKGCVGAEKSLFLHCDGGLLAGTGRRKSLHIAAWRGLPRQALHRGIIKRLLRFVLWLPETTTFLIAQGSKNSRCSRICFLPASPVVECRLAYLREVYHCSSWRCGCGRPLVAGRARIRLSRFFLLLWASLVSRGARHEPDH